MIQLTQGNRSPDFGLDSEAAGASRTLETSCLAPPPEALDEQAPDPPFLVVSPPPMSWPRIFPPL